MEVDCKESNEEEGLNAERASGAADKQDVGPSNKDDGEESGSLANGQPSRPRRRLVSSARSGRRKRKLHRCLNELKEYLLSINGDFISDSAAKSDPQSSINASTSAPISKRTMTGVDAVRHALQILKSNSRAEMTKEAPPFPHETTGETRVAIEVFPKTTSSSSRVRPCFEATTRCSSTNSNLATAADRCDDIVQERQDSIRFVVSCTDGLVLDVSENAYNLFQLSPHESSLVGRLFVSLFSPNDQPLLVEFMLNAGLASNSTAASSPAHSSKSTSNSSSSHENDSKSMKEQIFGLYASFRRDSPKSHIWPEEKSYIHCRLVCKLQSNHCQQQKRETEKVTQEKILSVTALPLRLLFDTENPEPSSVPPFYTKHTTTCIFTHVDTGCVRAWGYLPQELIGRSLLSYVSTDSLKWLETAHEQAVKAKGKPVRSKLYNFILRDRTLATMQTEWSLFVNPWTRETEFVIGYHKVIDLQKNCRFFHDHSHEPLDAKLAGRVAKAQSRIRRTLAKVKEQRHYKTQNVSKKTAVTASSSTTDKENGSSFSTTAGACTNQNGSTNDGTTNSFPASSSSKSKRVLNMGVYLDRMIETELFRNANAGNADGPSLGNCKFIVGAGSAEAEPASTNPAAHHETSPISAGEGVSSSPPDSNGSGPTYKEINLKEKVARFLNSQAAGQSGSSPDESNASVKSHSRAYSPSTYHEADPRPTIPVHPTSQPVAGGTESIGSKCLAHSMETNIGAIDLRTVAAAASLMHRSRSATGDLSQYRHWTAALDGGDSWNVPLTPETLRQFTKEKERESKADWKRRYSTADAPSPNLHNFQQQEQEPNYGSIGKGRGHSQQKSLDQISPPGKRAPFDQSAGLCTEAPPQKILRSTLAFQRETRPSSMPVISRAQNLTVEAGIVANKQASASSQWPNQQQNLAVEAGIVANKQATASSQWPNQQQTPLRNTTDYYRSLGPTPAPPPGKNFQISSAPLPPPSPPLDNFRNSNVDKISLPPMSSLNATHQSAFAPPPPKTAFVSAATQSVIQMPPVSSFSAQPPPGHWLNMPGTSASAILQRMVPKALAREQAEAATSGAFWPMSPHPSNLSSGGNPSENPLDVYVRNYQPSSLAASSNRDIRQYMEYSPVPQRAPATVNYPTENFYNEFSLNAEMAAQTTKPNDEVSPIREATESLLLLEES